MKGSEAGGPVLRDLTVSYLPRNQSPTVTLTAPASGDLLRGAQTIRWTGADPDKDTLTYQVLISADDGKSWQPLGERIRARSGGTGTVIAESDQPAKNELRQRIDENLAANPALARFRQALEDDPEVTEELRAEALKRADQLIAGVGTSHEEKGLPVTPSTPAADSTTAAGSSNSSTRETSIAWDTRRLADGVYRLKILATDQASNPGAPRTAETVSDPIRVVNRAPWVYLFKQSLQVSAERKVTLDGLAQNGAPLRGAQYRIDSGEWTALEPADGIWDGSFELWSVTTAPLRPGTRTIEVKVVDAAGNATARSLPVRVPAGGTGD
jgi:hypothetical protein